MPRLVNYGAGRRVNVWLPEKQLKVWDQIENKSSFVQAALDDAAGIMAFAVLKRERALQERISVDDIIGEYNEKFPLDPLTKQRLKKWTSAETNSQKKP